MRVAAALALAVLAYGAWASPPEAPAAPRQLRLEVSDFRDEGGKRWIRVQGAFEYVYRASLDRVVAALWDFRSSPEVFSRIEAIRVRSDTGTQAVTEQRTAVRVLGLAFVSNLVFRNALARPGPRSAVVSFETIETDGSCLSARGAWELEEIGDPGSPSTRVIYSLESYIEPRFPGQAAIMRSFGAADFRKVMRELGLAIGRS
jgi:hypothetical protein